MSRVLFGELTLGWRRATRGPLLWSLLGALVLTLLVLPGRGEGALVRLPYGLGLAWAVFLIAALWSGGSAYALDRERHRLTLTLTKPFTRWTLWWGRFLGTSAPFVFSLLLLWALLGLRPLPEGRTLLKPNLPDLSSLAQTELARLMQTGDAPEGVSTARLLRAVTDALEKRYTELPANTPLSYTFSLPDTLPLNAPATLRLDGAPFLGATQHLRLQIEATCNGQTATIIPTQLPDQTLEVALPKNLLVAKSPLTLTLTRLDTTPGASILYREREHLYLLLPGQHPLINLTAFTLILLMTLLMATALGTTLGSVFSLPVTLFVSTATLLAMSAAAFAPETTVMEEIATYWSRVSTIISNTISLPVDSFIQATPTHALFEGIAIPFRVLGTLLLFSCLPWIGLCSLFSLRRQ